MSPALGASAELPRARLPLVRLPMRPLAQPLLAPHLAGWDTSSNSAVRISDTPRTDWAAMACPAGDPSDPFDRRSAGSEPRLPLRSCPDSIARHALCVYRLPMIPGIVLAGGRSSRMGQPKALLPIGKAGETFLDRVTSSLLEGGVDGVLVVVGADADAIRQQAKERPRVRIVHNPDFERGQLTSMLAGLRSIDEPAASGLLVTLIDVPLVSPDTIRRLIGVHREHAASIVRPVSKGRHGHPVIFHRRLFDELRGADPARGAKPVVNAHSAEIDEVTVEDEGAFIDIDTPEDYERWIGPLLL